MDRRIHDVCHIQLPIDSTPDVEALPTRQQEHQSAKPEEVQWLISELKKSFTSLKDAVRECLEKREIIVKKVVNVLTSLSPDEDDQHKMFLESHVRELCAAADHFELFITMNFHWNYLDPSLLEHLVKEFELEEVTGQIQTYKENLEQFRMKTLLTIFCQTQKRKRIRPLGDFQEMVAVFDWPENVTLEDVEQFRQEYASHYNLQQCAMMIAHICPGSFIITWFIPESITDKLRDNTPTMIFKKYCVKKIDIAGTVVYQPAIIGGIGMVGLGGMVAGAVLTATGILAPVGIPLIVGGLISTGLGAAVTAAGAAGVIVRKQAMKEEIKRRKREAEEMKKKQKKRAEES